VSPAAGQRVDENRPTPYHHEYARNEIAGAHGALSARRTQTMSLARRLRAVIVTSCALLGPPMEATNPSGGGTKRAKPSESKRITGRHRRPSTRP
jgi:hypothetical protein